MSSKKKSKPFDWIRVVKSEVRLWRAGAGDVLGMEWSLSGTTVPVRHQLVVHY